MVERRWTIGIRRLIDQLRKRLGHDPATRLRALEQEQATVLSRDDLTVEFGAGTNSSQTMSATGIRDGFVARYSANGQLDWADWMGGDFKWSTHFPGVYLARWFYQCPSGHKCSCPFS